MPARARGSLHHTEATTVDNRGRPPGGDPLHIYGPTTPGEVGQKRRRFLLSLGTMGFQCTQAVSKTLAIGHAKGNIHRISGRLFFLRARSENRKYYDECACRMANQSRRVDHSGAVDGLVCFGVLSCSFVKVHVRIEMPPPPEGVGLAMDPTIFLAGAPHKRVRTRGSETRELVQLHFTYMQDSQ